MHFYQWLVPIISLFFIYRIISQFKANKRLLIGTLLWVAFWILIAFLGIFPDFVSISIAEYLGFRDHINAVIFVALGFLFLMTYYQSSTIENLEKQLTELVRKLALEKQEKIELKKKAKIQSKESISSAKDKLKHQTEE
jgi:hypothetical protein